MENCVKRLLQGQLLFDDCDQHVSGDRGPDLDFDRIGRRSEETLDAQVLSDPLEEQLDLPSLLVDGGNNGRRNLKIIGEEDKSLVDVGRVKADAPQRSGKLFRTLFAAQHDRLIRSNNRWCDQRRGNAVGGTGGSAWLSTRSRPSPDADGIAAKIDVASVHDNKATGFEYHMIEHVRVMSFDIGDVEQYGY